MNETNGNATRVAPEDLSKNFANILADEVVATKVKLTAKMHKAMNFRNEEEENLSQGGTTFVKDVGNATINLKLSFEYGFKSAAEIKA